VTWSSEVKRPNYRDGMYLGAQDFIAEQDYELDLRRRLCLGQHAWGVFEGLQLQEQLDPGSGATNVFILPGLAIDGFGRPVLVFVPQSLDVALFQGPAFQTDQWVKVWLLSTTAQTDPPRLGYELCDDPSLTTRTLETFRIAVGDQPGQHDPVRIASQPVPDSSLPPDTSVAYAALPDDSELARWPICLGQVHWNGVDAFVPSSDDDRRRYRALGGVIAAHAYAPEGTWDLTSRLRDTDPTKAAPVAATIDGSLTVQRGLLTARASVELDGGAILLKDAAGADPNGPVSITRLDGGATDLQIEIGRAAAGGHDRLTVTSGGSRRLTVQDDGFVEVSGRFQPDGVVDLTAGGLNGQDRILFAGPENTPDGTALGLETGGRSLYERARDGINWYVSAVSGGPAMALDQQRLRVTGDMLVGWRGNARLRTRHVDGKDYRSDGLDNLYLNWETGKDVVVGNPSGIASSLYVSGDIFIGRPPNQVRLVSPMDVQVGYRDVAGLTGPAGGTNSGFTQLTLTANLPSVSRAYLSVSLADVSNINVATDARWRIHWAGQTISGNQVTFDIFWRVDDDGAINAYSYVAVFFP
jgi:hypothetical protein